MTAAGGDARHRLPNGWGAPAVTRGTHPDVCWAHPDERWAHPEPGDYRHI
jgi:hypothetical protein